MIASAALLAAASLAGKALTYAPETAVSPGSDDARRIEDLLAASGWLRTGPAEPLPGGGLVVDFQVPGCSGVVRVGLLPPNGEMASLFAQTVGPGTQVFYAHHGRISGDPPRSAYFQAKLARVIASFGLSLRPDPPVVAIGQPQSCRLEAAAAWSEL